MVAVNRSAHNMSRELDLRVSMNEYNREQTKASKWFGVFAPKMHEVSIYLWLKIIYQKSTFLFFSIFIDRCTGKLRCQLDNMLVDWPQYFPQPSNYRLIKHWTHHDKTTYRIIILILNHLNAINKNCESAELQWVNWWIWTLV